MRNSIILYVTKKIEIYKKKINYPFARFIIRSRNWRINHIFFGTIITRFA